MDALVVKDLKKTYRGGVEALKGIELTVPKGGFYGLLGPNGAGKSTLIHCITGLAVPSSGIIEVFGHDAVTDYQAARQAVGLSPQELHSLDWFLTVEETLDFHGGYYGMSESQRKRRIPQLLKSFQLLEHRKKKSRALSGGMKRRLIIARALMHKPRMLILDEPTAGVDVELRLELWHYMQRVNKSGTTILLTTHYIEEAEQLCDQIGLINDGQIVKTGTVNELKKEFKKKTLEEVYLAVVGREELKRNAIV